MAKLSDYLQSRPLMPTLAPPQGAPFQRMQPPPPPGPAAPYYQLPLNTREGLNAQLGPPPPPTHGLQMENNPALMEYLDRYAKQQVPPPDEQMHFFPPGQEPSY